MKDLSIIVPAKDEEESLPELITWIDRVLNQASLKYEVIIIDDGSRDGTWSVVKKIAQSNSSVRGIRFNRNFGKSAALQTGFAEATGEVVVTMDADLQDSPEELPELRRMIIDEGYDLVSGWKRKRHDPVSKTIPSKFFNLVTRKISGIPLHDFNCGLKAYRNVVVKNITVYGEMHRYIPLIAKWAGFIKIGEKEVEHRERKFGTSKYGWERMMRGFLDLLTITIVGRFVQRPMHFFGTWGVLSFLAGLGFSASLVWQKIDSVFISKVPMRREIVDQPVFYFALVALLIGVQLFLTGFLAELLTRQSAAKKQYLVIDRVG